MTFTNKVMMFCFSIIEDKAIHSVLFLKKGI